MSGLGVVTPALNGGGLGEVLYGVKGVFFAYELEEGFQSLGG